MIADASDSPRKKGVGVCPFGNPGMAVAGMGDVLAGVCGALFAAPVPVARRRMELRGLGLARLSADQYAPVTRLCLVAELDGPEGERLPEPRVAAFLGLALPLLSVEGPQSAAALCLLLRNGGPLPTDGID